MAEPHHRRTVGYAMIAVSASLTIVGLLQLAIGENVLFGDDIQRAKTQEFKACKEINFIGEECRKFDSRLKVDALDSGKQLSTLEGVASSKGP